MALAHLKVIGVVGRGYLDCAGAEFRVHVIVSDDRYFPIHHRQYQRFSHQVPIALILRVNRHRHVAQHGLRAGGGYGKILVAVLHGVFYKIKVARFIQMLHLYIRNGGMAFGAPVGNVMTTVNETLFIKSYKHLQHGLRTALVHGETLPVPIAGRAQAP